jgi:O-methyltransferase
MSSWHWLSGYLSRLKRLLAGSDAELVALKEIRRLAPDRTLKLLECLRRGLDSATSEQDRFQAAESLSTAVYPKYRFSEYGRIYLEDEAFLSYYRQFMDVGNWHSLDRKYVLDQFLKLTQDVAGDAAECGTYKGASALRICMAFRGSDRLVHLFDSFAGLPAPEPCDGDYWVVGALRAPEESLQTTLAGFDNYRVYKGWIPERFQDVADRNFSFVHVDVDLYRPTLDSLEFFYPRMSPGGLMLMDDYGFTSCPGAKRAADEFFAHRPESIVMLPTGQSFVIKKQI